MGGHTSPRRPWRGPAGTAPFYEWCFGVKTVTTGALGHWGQADKVLQQGFRSTPSPLDLYLVRAYPVISTTCHVWHVTAQM